MRAVHRYALALVGLLLALPVAGSTPVAPAPTAPPVPLLWKVSDADNSIYLLGSFHLLAKSDYPLSPDIDRAFDDAESLVFEVAPEDLDDPGITGLMMGLAKSDPASSLDRALPADLKTPLDRRLRAMGLPPEQMGAFEPWFIDTMLVTLLGQRSGYAPEDGLDRNLMARARAAGKPATGLETVREQLTTLDGTPITEQIASLREFVDEGDNAGARLGELHSAWRDADIPTLERLTRDEMAELTPVTYQRLNVDRNRAWIPRLQALLAQGSGHDVLVVVGALHLLGDDGVVAMLRAKGYRVERICTACPASGSASH
ncbi:TraB/GumN family protein [Lysobacter claricitrinus]|uniref:TraB/GumN family protein n=1 Tax=Lysobacter claricitrinus TaxID=3367728 RepID=UPI0037DBBEFC